MKIKLGGKEWEISDSLSEEEQLKEVQAIKDKLIAQGIDPYMLSPEETEELRKLRLARYASEMEGMMFRDSDGKLKTLDEVVFQTKKK